MDGKIIIGTEIDDKGFNKGVKELENEDVEVEALLKAKGIELPTDEAKAIADELNENMALDLDTQSFDVQIAKAKTEILTYQTLLENANALELDDTDTLNLAVAIEKANNRLIQLQQQKDKVNKTGLDKLKSSIEDVGKGIKNAIKNVGKWALALFGIRGAFMAVRNAMSIISQEDQQLANDIQFMKVALAYTLEPIIRAIVNLMKQLMVYVAYVVKAWTGKDIFASASKNLKNGAKSAKDINKSLQQTSFDEMNVLQDNSSSAGAGGVGAGASSMGLEDVPIPSWLQWIVDHGEEVAIILGGIAGALVGVKLGLDPLQTLGAFFVGLGITLLIEDIIDLIDDPSWQNWLKVLTDISLIIGGIMLLMGSWWGLIVIISALIVKLFVENWDKIKEVLSKVWNWIDEHIIQPIVKGFTWLWDKIKAIFGPVVEFYKNIFTTVFNNIKTIVNNIASIFSWVWGKIKEIFTPVINFFKDKFTQARDKIKSVFEPIVNFFGQIWTKVKGKLTEFGTKVGEVVGGAFKSVINGVLKAVENILNFPIRSINKLIDTINDIPGINLKKLQTFNLPRLAKGGIVNMPGRGVPVGGAIAGEVSREGVIPLTDSQQMSLLGEAIGRYITINATITNTMNGRVISRELQKINNENSFANNN